MTKQPESKADGSAPACCALGGMRWQWPFFVLVAALLIFYARNYITAPSGPGIAWVDDYEAGIAQARQEDKPVLMAFSATWCSACQQNKRNVYPDEQVREASERFVPIYVDVEKRRDLATEYNIEYLPTYVILAPDGETLYRFMGSQTAAGFVDELQAGLDLLDLAEAGAGTPAERAATAGMGAPAGG